MSSYRIEARSDARDTATYFLDEIIEQLIESGEASDDLFNDYHDGDAYHHESHVDRDYRLLDAAQLLDELSDHEETDSGLWEGLKPREAIAAQAAYTYGAAVLSFWSDLIKEINDDDEVSALLEPSPRELEPDDVPADYPVQPIQDDDEAIAPATCGHCGLTWDDGKVTGLTPTPSARCPFETFHETNEPDEQQLRARVVAIIRYF